MDNQFISSVRIKIDKKKKRRRVAGYASKLIPILIVMFLFVPDSLNNDLDDSYFISYEGVISQDSYVLTEEDILLYLIEEMDLDEFLGLSFENNLFEHTVLNEEGI